MFVASVNHGRGIVQGIQRQRIKGEYILLDPSLITEPVITADMIWI
jgi:hypothetical protein